jgi:hypothetical protein
VAPLWVERKNILKTENKKTRWIKVRERRTEGKKKKINPNLIEEIRSERSMYVVSAL